jgi:hypothetical protein
MLPSDREPPRPDEDETRATDVPVLFEVLLPLFEPPLALAFLAIFIAPTF